MRYPKAKLAIRPAAADRNVFTKIRGTVSSRAPLLPPLKPNQPNHKIKVPRAAKGRLLPLNFCTVLSFLKRPKRGPITIAALSAIHPPTL